MKRLFSLVLLAALAFTAVGCSTLNFWAEDTGNKIKVWRRDLHHAHKTFDWYFLNYNWDDPYL